nr:hypothetical protein [Kofleriaceae bacterium]
SPRTADAQAWAEPDPAAVVGRWSGPVSWRGCAIDVARAATLELVRDGTGYRLALAPLADGLAAEELVAAGATELRFDRADRHGIWQLGRAGRATLTVRLGASCVVTARLRRASSGAAACDELLGLRAIAATCPAVPADDVPALPPRRQAARCARVAAPLRDALTTAGCLPTPRPTGGVRIAECEALLATVARATRCNRIPVDVKQRLGEQARLVAASAAVDDPAARAELATTCQATADELSALLPRLGC